MPNYAKLLTLAPLHKKQLNTFAVFFCNIDGNILEKVLFKSPAEVLQSSVQFIPKTFPAAQGLKTPWFRVQHLILLSWGCSSIHVFGSACRMNFLSMVSQQKELHSNQSVAYEHYTTALALSHKCVELPLALWILHSTLITRKSHFPWGGPVESQENWKTHLRPPLDPAGPLYHPPRTRTTQKPASPYMGQPLYRCRVKL